MQFNMTYLSLVKIVCSVNSEVLGCCFKGDVLIFFIDFR